MAVLLVGVFALVLLRWNDVTSKRDSGTKAMAEVIVKQRVSGALSFVTCLNLDEEFRANVKELCQSFCLRFADGTLAVKNLGGNSF
jgi:hypothetical protein